MDPCILYGGVISVVVSVLKRIPFIGKNPKVIATVLAAILPVAGLFAHGLTWETIATAAKCLAVQLGSSVATYELITNNAARALGVKAPSTTAAP